MSKKESSVEVKRNGIGCLTILGIAFVIMKLSQVGVVADWSWWWVLSPFLIQFAILAVILVFMLCVALVGLIIAAIAWCHND